MFNMCMLTFTSFLKSMSSYMQDAYHCKTFIVTELLASPANFEVL